jgi:non-heme chloroperoxidase
VPALVERGLRVITYDRRGFGRSAQPWGGYDYTTLAGDLHAVLEAYDLRDAGLVGYSMGGGEVARYLGTQGRDRVGRAVLLGAVTPYLLKDAGNPEGVDASVFEEIFTGLQNDRPGFLGPFAKRFFGAGLLNFSISSELLHWFQFMALHGSGRATLECARAWATTDFRADLPRIAVPTLLIHGTGDQNVPIDVSARRAAPMIPGARLLEYEGEPHALFYTARDRLNRDLADFLAG